MPKGLESNIWKYTVLLVANKRIFTAIIGVYYLTIPGVTPFWIGIFLLVGNGASLIFDIPSSYIADKIGHKDALVLSRIIIFLSTFFFLFATNVWWLIAGSILMSIGFAFLSGVGSAFMHETLRGLGREDEYRAVAGKASSFGFAIPAILAAIVPFLVPISYKLPFIVMIILDFIGIIVALMFVRPHVTPEHLAEVHGTRFIEVIRQGLALRFFRIATFSGIVSAFIFATDNFRGPYQLVLGVPVIWFGIFFGIGRALAALLLAYSGRIHHLIGDIYSFQRIQILIYGILLVMIGLVTNPWVVVILFIIDNALRHGTSQIDTGYQLEIIRDNKFRATLLSAGNQIQNIISMCTVGIMGAFVEIFGYRHAFIYMALLFLLSSIPLYFYTIRNKDKYATQ